MSSSGQPPQTFFEYITGAKSDFTTKAIIKHGQLSLLLHALVSQGVKE